MSLNYTTGNPANLVGGGTANMNDIQGTFTDIKTWADAKFSAADLTTATLQTLGINSGSQVGRGKANISTSESTSATTYAIGNLTTPDRVSGIVLPTDGLIVVAYQALWQNTVAGNARAAIFVGSNQVKIAPAGGGGGVPVVQEAIGNSTINIDAALVTSQDSGGLGSVAATSNTTEVTTGQIIGRASTVAGGPIYIFAAAGTYDISVQFKNSAAGTLTVKNRHLWVWTLGF